MVIDDKGRKNGLSDYDVRFIERDIKDLMALLDSYQRSRDHLAEALFLAIYQNPWMEFLLPATSLKRQPDGQEQKERREEVARIRNEKRHWRSLLEQGGYEEGVIRIIMAMEDSDHAIDRDALYKD